MDQPPGTPALADFSLDVGKYFESAFAQSTRDQRPSAADWVHVLDSLEASLVPCSENKLHFLPRDADECPWCYMENQLGTVLFVPFVPVAKLIVGVDPGAAAFNIDAIWKQISAVTIPPRSKILPKLAPVGAPPGSSIAERLSSKFRRLQWPRVICAIAAIGLLVLAPKLWLISLGLAAYAFFARRDSKDDKAQPLHQKFLDAQKRWHTEVVAWQRRIGVDDFLQLEQQLRAARDEYISLDQQKRRESRLQEPAAAKQLSPFSKTEIRNATIKGIGVAKQATLASYGVDTAADITMSKILAVPGIGNAIAQDLLKWRAACESRFMYSEATNQTDAQELTKISLKYATKAASLRPRLSAGAANLAALARRIQAASELEDPLVSRVNGESELLKYNLRNFGAARPGYTFDWSTLTSTSTLPSPAPATPRIPPVSASSARSRKWSSSTPSCPRCGSTMVHRVARRGRNAGGSFWGCSRFPRCRGTRN